MYGSSCLIASWNCRFLKLDDLESFLQDSEKAAARDNDDEDDAEDRLGEGKLPVLPVIAPLLCNKCKWQLCYTHEK